MFTKDIGIDLGTANVLIYIKILTINALFKSFMIFF